MTTTTDDLANAGARTELAANLSAYYLVRAIVAAAWAVAAVAIGHSNAITATLLVSYPAWDALANWFDRPRISCVHPSYARCLAATY